MLRSRFSESPGIWKVEREFVELGKCYVNSIAVMAPNEKFAQVKEITSRGQFMKVCLNSLSFPFRVSSTPDPSMA